MLVLGFELLEDLLDEVEPSFFLILLDELLLFDDVDGFVDVEPDGFDEDDGLVKLPLLSDTDGVADLPGSGVVGFELLFELLLEDGAGVAGVVPKLPLRSVVVGAGVDLAGACGLAAGC